MKSGVIDEKKNISNLPLSLLPFLLLLLALLGVLLTLLALPGLPQPQPLLQRKLCNQQIFAPEPGIDGLE